MHAVLLLALTLAGNDDRDVIQAALLSFYKKETWHAGDWEPKQPIQLLDKFGKDEPMSMELILRALKVDADSAWARLKKESKTPRDKEYLRYYESTSQELGRIIPLAKQKGTLPHPGWLTSETSLGRLAFNWSIGSTAATDRVPFRLALQGRATRRTASLLGCSSACPGRSIPQMSTS